MSAVPEGAPAHWWQLAAALREAVPQVEAIARAVHEARPDGCGREWAERAGLVHRRLSRELTILEALIDAAGRALRDRGPAGSGPVPPGSSPGTGSAGRARLAGTAGDRADPGLGPRIATLPGDAG